MLTIIGVVITLNITDESIFESNSNSQEPVVSSIDNTKDIIYNLSDEPYPIINLSSQEVKEINAELKKKYESYNNNPHGLKLKYDYYLSNEILSLVITIPIHTGGYNYNVYNINTNTGKSVSNTELLKNKNIDETTFLSKLPEYYKNKFLEVHSEIIEYNPRI